jgi:cation diffusion facilitator family transporter
MASPQNGSSSQRLRAFSIEGEDETSVVLPPSSSATAEIAYNNHPSVFRKSWRLNSETFETQKKTEAQIAGLHRRLPRHFNADSKDGIVAYYRKQNQLVENFQEMESLMGREEEKTIDADGFVGGTLADDASVDAEDWKLARRARREEFALRISFWANVALLFIKVFAAYSSGSLSIITSALDSFLDLVSGLILWRTEESMRKQNKYLFPAGKSRMQPLGIIVFSCIMGTLGFQILIEGVQQLVGPNHTHHLEDIYGVIGVMITVIFVKFALYLYCRKSASPAVQTYAQDHRNDVATNAVGLMSAMLGDRFYFWIDPLGAILLAAYIIYNWSETALENIKAMVGVSAPPEFLTRLTYLAWNHHPEIACIDTVRAYTFGPKYFVEVDVVLPEEMPLRRAHDIGESLQNTIEAMTEVERAFVHIDFETAHYPEHGERDRAVRDRAERVARAEKEKRDEERNRV